MFEPLSVTLDDNVADTLFIPLYMRNLETLRVDGIIHDPLSCTLVNQIDYDFSKYNTAKKSIIGTAIRIRRFDKAVTEFIKNNDNPVVISIGAGLDTRFKRVFNGKGIFYELDLPEVINVRSQLLPESKNNPYIAKSFFDISWIDQIVEKHVGSNFILVAEGVFMYFEEELLRQTITIIADRIPQGELHFDVSSKWAVQNQKKHDTVKNSNATFQWGLEDDLLLEKWSPYLRYQDTTYYMDQELKRWGFFVRIMRLMPKWRNAFRMLHYKIESKP